MSVSAAELDGASIRFVSSILLGTISFKISVAALSVLSADIAEAKCKYSRVPGKDMISRDQIENKNQQH